MKAARIAVMSLQLLACGLLVLPVLAEQENPIQGSEADVNGGPNTSSVRAEIIPLFWKAIIGKSVVSVPLKSIEYFGIQTYNVNGVARVRELTISTNSQSMVRIYHMLPISAVAERAEKTLQTLGRIAEGATDEEINVPVKEYPTTTHEHMVEYRVTKRADIDTLYQHLETAMKDYHARNLVSGQRGQTVREVNVSSTPAE